MGRASVLQRCGFCLSCSREKNLQINNKHAAKENVWECESAHRKSPGNLQIQMAGSQHEEYCLPIAIFGMLQLVINFTLE